MRKQLKAFSDSEGRSCKPNIEVFGANRKEINEKRDHLNRKEEAGRS